MLAQTRRNTLRVLFVTTSMPVGGAETLLVNLIRRLDRERFSPELVCLKQRGPLGEELAAEIPVHSELIHGKWDVRVLSRLIRIFLRPQAAAVITVGAGDKMFWGRIAARLAGVRVVCSALHSTGWPDEVGRLNRMLTRWTDAFIGVADGQSRYLAEKYGFPPHKVHTIYNGVDVDRFTPGEADHIRQELSLGAETPLVGIVAALRPEKNHELFLRGAREIAEQVPETHFVIVGDGPRRDELEALSGELGLGSRVHWLGSRSDVPDILAACDLLALTSLNEASPVSILEALSSSCAVVASDVGSVRETIVPEETGLLFESGDREAFVSATIRLLGDRALRSRLASTGRQRVIDRWSLEGMVRGYEQLLTQLHATGAPRTEPTVAAGRHRRKAPG
jgi:glycosyltransferase involved in cell wall biosynthesis